MRALLGAALQAAVILGLLQGAVAYAVLAERRLLARFQTRVGPNRVGPWGLLQPIADGVKLFLKEEIAPAAADPWPYRIAPVLGLVPAFVGFAAIPFAASFVVSDLSIGLLFVLAATSLGVYSVMLAGWASNSKYALLGGLRASAQLISYELAMGLSLLAVVLMAGTLSLRGIVEAQAVPFVLVQPLAFAIAFVAAVAETNRSPFDLPEAETELVAGFHTEYSGMKFALFFMAEYAHIFLSSALLAVCFLGGWRGPLLPGPAWLAIKVAALFFGFVWIRATLPRFRYDHLMSFGWKAMVPAAFLNLCATAAVLCWA